MVIGKPSGTPGVVTYGSHLSPKSPSGSAKFARICAKSPCACAKFACACAKFTRVCAKFTWVRGMFHLGLRCICMRVPGIYLVLLYIFVGLAQDFEYQRRLLSLLFMCMPPSVYTLLRPRLKVSFLKRMGTVCS